MYILTYVYSGRDYCDTATEADSAADSDTDTDTDIDTEISWTTKINSMRLCRRWLSCQYILSCFIQPTKLVTLDIQVTSLQFVLYYVKNFVSKLLVIWH